MASPFDWLDRVREMLAHEQPAAAFAELRRAAAEVHDFQGASQISQLLDAIPDGQALGRQLRIAILRSFTVEPVVPLLRTCLLARGLRAQVGVAAFNQFEQYFFEGAGHASLGQPDLLVIAARIEELAPELAYRRLALSARAVDELLSSVTDRVEGWIRSFRLQSSARILLHNMALPRYPALSLLDAQSEWGQQRVVEDLNARLAELCRAHGDVYLLDYRQLQAQVGIASFADDRLAHLARQPLSRPAIQGLATLYARWVCAAFTPRRKCLVLDLDNTLWGGILGEDGPQGIQLGTDYPGSAFVDFQRALLNLSDRGIILAVNSKNNEEDVREVLSSHPHMVLQPQHLAIIKANWRPKPENMREVAAELNIGLDSLVFIDDSPHECALMRQLLPEVLTVQLPTDPLAYLQTLDSIWEFDTIAYSEEDRARTQEYQAQASRKTMQQSSRSLEEFYYSLQMEVTILPVDKPIIPRVAQLTQKTNQFNLTTRRYSEAGIADMLQKSTHEVYYLRVSDRFGDSGIVGVGILRLEGVSAYIDTLLLSCRVLGRGIEDAFLGYLVERARQRSAQCIVGEHAATAKNRQVEGFYGRFGFARQAQSDSSRQLWTAELEDLRVPIPGWLRVTTAE